MNNRVVETVTGALVVAAAVIFGVVAYQTTGFSGSGKGYHVKAEFDNVEGINVGTDIRMAGIKIGTVTEQTLNPDNFQAVITMAIDPAVKLTDDTTAKVTAEGLLGSKFIALEPGGSETRLGEGGFITSTQGAVDIWSLISQAMFDKSNSAKAAEPAPPGSVPNMAPDAPAQP